MAVKHFKLPDPGEGLVEAEIVTWRVKVGDTVKVNDIIVEIETSKSLVELPVPYAGTVTALMASEGDTVLVGSPIISVDDGLGGDVAPAAVSDAVSPAAAAEDEPGESTARVPNLVGYGPRVTSTKRRARNTPGAAAPAAAPAAQPAPPQPAATKPAVADPVVALPVSTQPVANQPVATAKAVGGSVSGVSRVMAKPPVRKLAKDLGVELSQVAGSGDGGIVTRADVEAHAAGAGAAAYVSPVFAAAGERETRIPVKGVRKMTAQAMVASAFSAPHVTEFITVDVTPMMKLVDQLRTDREFRDVKVSPLLIVAKALLIASRRNPGINATWDEAAQEIVVKNYVNLGIAAATPRGLMVPNIKDADQLSLRQLADAMANLVSTAREGRTQPAEMSGRSITITNVGV
ncbi:MAG: hypothetical protein QOE58_3648, partial [Actinomycetota bacterium]|nr:hypothetical protein [Actinomycetota bacterium]